MDNMINKPNYIWHEILVLSFRELPETVLVDNRGFIFGDAF
jgi:hypothetical protein